MTEICVSEGLDLDFENAQIHVCTTFLFTFIMKISLKHFPFLMFQTVF